VSVCDAACDMHVCAFSPLTDPALSDLLNSTPSSFTYAALSLHFKKPLMIVEGKQQYLYDDKGRRYLDVRTR